MSLVLDVGPQIEARIFDFAKREGIDPSSWIAKLVSEYRPVDQNDGDDELGGKTLGELYGHLFGTVSFEPNDVSQRAEEYLTLTGFGNTSNPRNFPNDSL